MCIRDRIRAIHEACDGRILKVIIETCLLTEEEKIKMCEIVTNAGAESVSYTHLDVYKRQVYEQLDLFTDYEAQRKKQEEEEVALDREKRMQEAMLSIKKKFGKNAVLKGMNLQEGATAKDRNKQIGGHKA